MTGRASVLLQNFLDFFLPLLAMNDLGPDYQANICEVTRKLLRECEGFEYPGATARCFNCDKLTEKVRVYVCLTHLAKRRFSFPQPLRCSACKAIKYCSASCQKDAWKTKFVEEGGMPVFQKGHKFQCAGLKVRYHEQFSFA